MSHESGESFIEKPAGDVAAELNKAIEWRKWTLIMLNVDPTLDFLRQDPRFSELVRSVGLK